MSLARAWGAHVFYREVVNCSIDKLPPWVHSNTRLSTSEFRYLYVLILFMVHRWQRYCRGSYTILERYENHEYQSISRMVYFAMSFSKTTYRLLERPPVPAIQTNGSGRWCFHLTGYGKVYLGLNCFQYDSIDGTLQIMCELRLSTC